MNPSFPSIEEITHGMQTAVALAIRRHKLLGEAIAVWEDNEVKVIAAIDIPEAWTQPPVKINANNTILD